MRVTLIAAIVVAALLAGPRQSSAQERRGFVTLVVSSNVDDDPPQGISAGVVLDLAKGWVSVGGQATLFLSNGYAGGRGGPIVQVNPGRRMTFRVFGIGGWAGGTEGGPMYGVGVESGSPGRLGVRASLENYFARLQGFGDKRRLRHSVQIGITWH